ncbi:MAG: E3 binding domain-containing protein, partial [Actinobacteria bacterium]|nr:E3 binding domain-containing protein [Actinomycetota bacterium]
MSNISMPQLGESVTEGTIGRWLKNEGDFVAKDEPLVEIITDKVTAEMPSPVEGILQQILTPEGQTVSVGTDIAVVGSEASAGESVAKEAALAAAPSREEAIAQVVREATEVVQQAHQRSSPLVRRLAQEYGVDLGQVQGSGLGGRVTKDDILNFVAQRKA